MLPPKYLSAIFFIFCFYFLLVSEVRFVTQYFTPSDNFVKLNFCSALRHHWNLGTNGWHLCLKGKNCNLWPSLLKYSV